MNRCRAKGRAARGLAAALAGAICLAPAAARADEEPDSDPGEVGAITGVVTLVASSLVGGLLLARGENHDVKNAGVNVAGFGFAVAPFAAHAATDEWARGAAFSAAPLAMAAADLTLLVREPNLIDEQGGPTTRVPFAVFFTVGLTTGVVGVVDAMFATARRDRDRDPNAPHVSLLPEVGPQGGSLALTGGF